MTKKEQILKHLSEPVSLGRITHNQLVRRLGMNDNTARGRLSELERDGYIARTVYGTPGQSDSTYALTEKGRIAASRVKTPALIPATTSA